MKIVPASQNQFPPALALLEDNALPTGDITPGTQLFVAEEDNTVIGTVAVEYDYQNALLRSLSVSKEKRKSGIGAGLVDFMEYYLKKQGVEAVYILTTTAETFFAHRGYRVIGRDEVPSFIQNTTEFRLVCPASSTLMLKRLS